MPSVISIAKGRWPHQGHQLIRFWSSCCRTLGGAASAVLLRDSGTGHAYSRIRERWDEIEDPEEAELLESLDQDFKAKIAEMGGDEFLRYIEDSLSNALRKASGSGSRLRRGCK